MDKLNVFNDGQEVVDYFAEILTSLISDNSQTHIQPVSLLILDVNMPILGGFETLKLVKQMFDTHNEFNQNSRPSTESVAGQSKHVMRPLMCFFTQLDRNQFVHFFNDDE